MRRRRKCARFCQSACSRARELEVEFVHERGGGQRVTRPRGEFATCCAPKFVVHEWKHLVECFLLSRAEIGEQPGDCRVLRAQPAPPHLAWRDLMVQALAAPRREQTSDLRSSAHRSHLACQLRFEQRPLKIVIAEYGMFTIQPQRPFSGARGAVGTLASGGVRGTAHLLVGAAPPQRGVGGGVAHLLPE